MLQSLQTNMMGVRSKPSEISLTFLVLLSCFLRLSVGLTCQSCDMASCDVVTECAAGMVMDVCNCCPLCAQAEGEICGGKFEMDGKCGMELYCRQPYHSGDDLTDNSNTGTCAACEQVIHTGCNVIQGVCQCGDSCTHSFEYADRDTCLNSVKSQGSSDECSAKICPQTESNLDCPEDSFRPKKKLSLDGCCEITQPCECIDKTCTPTPTCPQGTRLAELSRGDGTPGSCCSSFTCINATTFRCEVGNSTFADGQLMTMDDCMQCRCKDGIVLCDQMRCENPSCEWLSLDKDECCTTCKGCVSSMTSERYLNGQSWTENNSCIQCTCVDGQKHCTASACERRCQNPRKLPGVCCPICDEEEDIYEPLSTTSLAPVLCPATTDCPSNCRRKIMVDINGCSVCFCEDDINMCAGSTGCTKVCTHGYKKDHELGCSQCRCNKCAPYSCNLFCSHGYTKDGNGCNQCECKALVTESPRPVGVCFTSEGRTYASGDSWFDGCRECYCENGRELCSLISCPHLTCSQPVVKSIDCCPSCPADKEVNTKVLNISTGCIATDGGRYSEAEVWQLDTCTVCMCHRGQALCETQRCPPTLCSNPVKKEGKCCAQCADTKESHLTIKTGKACVTSAGVTFDHGNIWKVSDCQSCVCQNGAVSCFSQVCPILMCKTTVQQKGHCCPKCTAENVYDRVCVYESSWYKHLDTWTDGNLQCICIHGNSQCESAADCVGCEDNSITEEKEQSIPLSIGLPMLIMSLILLLIFAVVIVILVIYIVKQRKKRKSNLTAIPKILEHRAMNRDAALMKKRPKSTNLEFLHATNDNRYNTAIVRGDTDCFRPLVDENNHTNEYVHC